MMNRFNFEDYWKPWETGSHWELKREFIERYKNMFNEERLLCLAQAYSNIMLMNCRYPDPVMRQISELARPLQKYKRFQEINSDVGVKRRINEEQIDLEYSEKNYSTYEHSERSFKQIKFSIDKDQSTSAFLPASTITLQSSVEQCRNTYSVPLYQETAEIVSKSEQVFQTSHSTIKKTQPVFQIKDIFIEKEKESRIISALGLPFIKKFAENIKSCVDRFSIPIEIIQCASYKLGMKNNKNYHFELDVDPDSPTHATSYFSKFFIKNCEIACETSPIKKSSKALCAEAAINTIIKLSTVDRVIPLKKFRPNVHRITNIREILEIFKRNIINRVKDEPAIITFKSIASLVDMENYIDFYVISNEVSSTVTEYTCKFFLKNVLISYATDESAQSAKNVAAEFGLIKLSNLDKYEIYKGELKKKLNPNNKSIYAASSYSNAKSCDNEINNSEKPSFILNKVLFDSSKKDCLLLIERDSRKSNILKDVRSLVSESAGFCRKKYFVDVEDGNTPPFKKVKVLVAGEVAGTGVAFSIDEGKTVACVRAYINFKKKYYTLRVKDKSFEGFIVNRDQMFDGESYSKNVLSKTYLGCKTFRKRGSSNKDARRAMHKFLKDKFPVNTVTEHPPVNTVTEHQPVNTVTEHQPVNTDTDSAPTKKHQDLHLFRQHTETMLIEFMESEDYCDLLFSSEFSPVEKVEIIKIAKRLQLRPKLHVKEDGDKFVCVKHKLDVPKLLDYLVKNNGCSSKFELIDDSETVI